MIQEEWRELGLNPFGVLLGRASYSVHALLGIWVYGFLVGIRSNRKLETACREQLPFLWLSGMAMPDHNTLWGFYHAHRRAMRKLLRRTIRVAVGAGLVDLAVQAVDGTKIWGSASRDRFRSRAGLTELLAKTDAAIADLEAQNATSAASLPALPKALKSQEKLREKITTALAVLPPDPVAPGDPAGAGTLADGTVAKPGTATSAGKKQTSGKGKSADRGPRASITDPDVRVMKGRHNRFGLGYNAQAAASPLVVDAAGRQGSLVTAALVSQHAGDVDELIRMLEEAEATTGVRADTTLADGGYHSATNLAAAAAREQVVLVPDPKTPAPDDRYAKEYFVYDPVSDTYRCPEDQVLARQRTPVPRGEDHPAAIRYRAKRSVCQACPVHARCQGGVLGQQAHGRSITITPDEARLQAHREVMAQEESRARYAKRKEWIEPKFGTVKTEQDGDHFLLRGLENVTDEWHLLNTAGNLRTLWRRWVTLPAAERLGLTVRAA